MRILTSTVRLQKNGTLDTIKWSDRISGLIDYAWHRLQLDGFLSYTGLDVRRALREAQTLADFDLPAFDDERNLD